MSSFTRLLIISVTLIALVGQGFALGISECDMDHDMTSMVMTSMSPSSEEHAGMNHGEAHSADQHHGEHHQMAMADESASTTAMDCCDIQCSCPTNACSSASFLFSSSLAEVPQFKSGNYRPVHDTDIQKRSNSLYRPPIFA